MQRVGGAGAQEGVCRGRGRSGRVCDGATRKGCKHKQTPAVVKGSFKGCTGGDGGRVLQPAQLRRFSGRARFTLCNAPSASRRMGELDGRRRRHPPPRPPSPAAPRSPTTLSSHRMVMRLAVARPLGQAARATGCSRAAVRTFAATALRAKEIAGQSKDTPNMRVRRIAAFGVTWSADTVRSMRPATPRASSRPPS